MSIGERIKKLRKELDLTQQKFGGRIGIKGNTVAQYELGRSNPIDAVISLICREFDVREEWLRNGTGSMFVEIPEEDYFSAAAVSLIKDNDALAIEALKLYYSLRPEEKAAVTEYILRLADMIREHWATQAENEPAPNPTVDDLEAEYKKSVSASVRSMDSHASNTTSDERNNKAAG